MEEDKSGKDDHGYHLFPQRDPRSPKPEPFISKLYGLKIRCKARLKIAMETSGCHRSGGCYSSTQGGLEVYPYCSALCAPPTCALLLSCIYMVGRKCNSITRRIIRIL
ncbi:hypothetical protein GDO81_029235 [Engystomops pustulosus]|uniref:Uncharacterized protein n=1 Tax=Engystomops pustulosus TaxID=76066 RepID=A0AAV6YCY6_ENGPU|nr:hypothetical protein GDO81_029235 [Engystomops pustulosus]